MAMNPSDILGALLQGDSNSVANQRLGTAASGGLGGLLQQVMGAGGGTAGASGGGGLAGIAQSIFGGGTAGVGAGSALGGLAEQAQGWMKQNPGMAAGGIGALAGALFGGSARGAVGGAALGMLGMVAMNALKAMNQPAAADPAAPAAPQLTVDEARAALPADPDAAAHRAKLLISAMISAAKADGNIDDAEMQTIASKLQTAGIDAEGQQWVLGEMAKPVDLDALAGAVPDAETGAQVYAASLLAITVDTPAEQDYLRQLAQKLSLPQAAVASIHQALGVQVNSAI